MARGEICPAEVMVNTKGTGPYPNPWQGAGTAHEDVLEVDFSKRMETFPSTQLRSSILDELGGFNE